MQEPTNHLSSPSSMAVKSVPSHAFLARPIFKSSNCGAKVEVPSSRNQRPTIGMRIRWRELRVGCGFTCGWSVEELTEVNVRRGEVGMVFRRKRALTREHAVMARSRHKRHKSAAEILIRSGGGGRGYRNFLGGVADRERCYVDVVTSMSFVIRKEFSLTFILPAIQAKLNQTGHVVIIQIFYRAQSFVLIKLPSPYRPRLR